MIGGGSVTGIKNGTLYGMRGSQNRTKWLWRSGILRQNSFMWLCRICNSERGAEHSLLHLRRATVFDYTMYWINCLQQRR